MQYYTIEEYATITKLPPNTVRYLCRQGKLDCIKLGRKWRIKDTNVGSIETNSIETSLNEINEKLNKILKIIENRTIVVSLKNEGNN